MKDLNHWIWKVLTGIKLYKGRNLTLSKKSKKDRKEKRQKVNDEFHQRVLNGKIEEVEEKEIEVEEFEETTFEDDLKEIEEHNYK